MVSVERGSVEELLGDEPLAREVYDALAGLVDDLGPATRAGHEEPGRLPPAQGVLLGLAAGDVPVTSDR